MSALLGPTRGLIETDRIVGQGGQADGEKQGSEQNAHGHLGQRRGAEKSAIVGNPRLAVEALTPGIRRLVEGGAQARPTSLTLGIPPAWPG